MCFYGDFTGVNKLLNLYPIWDTLERHLDTHLMSKTAMIRARIEPKLKSSAENALKKMGFTPTEAITIFYRQVVIQKAIPFEVRLERDDIPENYINVRDDKHFAELIGLKDVPKRSTSRSRKGIPKGSAKNKGKSRNI
jgi:addiction module RelB/DinJ family antitoxin